MNTTTPATNEPKPSRMVLLVWAVLASIAAVTFALATLLCLLYLPPGRESKEAPSANNTATLEPQDPQVARRAEAEVKLVDAGGREDFWPGDPDLHGYAASNSVGIVLGEVESGTGLCLLDESDGRTEVTNVNEKACRAMKPTAQMRADPNRSGFIYFVIHPSFKRPEVKSYRIEVEYCGGPRGDFGLQYDALAPRRTLSAVYTRASPTVYLSTPDQWKTATFRLPNAAFENGQNGGADFRLVVRPPQLWVRRVTVTRDLETPPKAGSAP
jgi:hypothetical protein